MASAASLLRYLSNPLVTALSLAGVALLSEFALYQNLVLPKLPESQYVPLGWWLTMLIPLALTSLLLGFSCRSIRSVLASASAGTLGLVAYEFVMARLNQPGHLKSFAIEDPVYFFITHALVIFVAVLIVVLAGFEAHRLIDHRRESLVL